MCICTGEGRTVRTIGNNFDRLIKERFTLRKNPLKQVLVDAWVVIAFVSEIPRDISDDEPDEIVESETTIFYHIGDHELKPFRAHFQEMDGINLTFNRALSSSVSRDPVDLVANGIFHTM